MSGTQRAGTFADQVIVLFATDVVASGIGFVNAFIFAKLLGPAGKGDYYLLVLPPQTIMVLIQFGLPQALGFYAARGKTSGIVAKALVLITALSLAAFTAAVALLPVLRETFLRGLEPTEIILALSAIPVLLTATFMTSIVIARQAIRWYAAVHISTTLAATFLLLLIVGVLGFGVMGAVAAFLIYSSFAAIGYLAGAIRVSAATPEPGRLRYRELFRFGLPLYPGSITMFFSYRIDVFILAALLADPSAPLGYYSVAVTLAELVFWVPSSVSKIFFPRVAGSSREDADHQVPAVSRVTLLLTALVALVLAPGATLLLWLLLPAFLPSLAPLYVLLPGVVALSITRVVSGYVSGLGLTGTTSLVNIGAFVLNIAANFLLIPQFGIVGAAFASLVSYSASSIAITLIAARLAHAPVHDFWLPRRADLLFVTTTMRALGRRMLGAIRRGR